MFLDDEEPSKKKPVLKNLEMMGVQELEDYIASLQAEQERARAVIKSKQSAKTLADQFFKKESDHA